jgi:hypothetical protein
MQYLKFKIKDMFTVAVKGQIPPNQIQFEKKSHTTYQFYVANQLANPLLASLTWISI